MKGDYMPSFSKVFGGIPTQEDFDEVRSKNESLTKITLMTEFEGRKIQMEFNHAKLIKKGDGCFNFDSYILINEDKDRYMLLVVRPDMEIGVLEYKYPALPWQVDESFNYYLSKEIDDLGRETYKKYYKK